jgi:hypothetical protein
LKLNKWEKLLCVTVPFCTSLDAFFTLYFARGKSHIISNEMNSLMVWAVVHDISSFVIFLFSLVITFILTVMAITILQKTNNAYRLFVAIMITLCILRPLAGLTWYVDTAEYTGIVITLFNICGILMLIAIGLYVKEVLNTKTDAEPTNIKTLQL